MAPWKGAKRMREEQLREDDAQKGGGNTGLQFRRA